MALGAATLRGPFDSALLPTPLPGEALARHDRAGTARPVLSLGLGSGSLAVADPLPWPSRTGEARTAIPGV